MAALAAAVVVGCDGRSRPSQASRTSASQETKANAEAARLLRQAAASLERAGSVTAKLRQTVQLYGHKMAGHGRYLQMRNPKADVKASNEPTADNPTADRKGFTADVLSRTELTLQVRERMATWEQVCDGEALWTYRKVPDADNEYSTRLDRVDLPEVVKKVGDLPAGSGLLAWGMGGLSGVLAGLEEAFEFHQLRSDEIHGKPVVPVWVLQGRWKQDKLIAFLPDQAKDIRAGRADLSKLPPRVPEEVSIALGKQDLFPFRIVYHRRDPETRQLQEAVKIELYEVAFGTPLALEQFEPTRTGKANNDTKRFTQWYQRR